MGNRSVYISNLAAVGDEAISLLRSIILNRSLKIEDRTRACEVLLSHYAVVMSGLEPAEGEGEDGSG